MKLWKKVILLGIVFYTNNNAFAIVRTYGTLGYVGYSNANDFSNTALNNTFGIMSGFNAGASALVTFTPRTIAPVVGAGLDYMSLTSSNSDVSGVYNYKNTMTTKSVIGNFGVRGYIRRFKILLLGNIGYGLDDTLNSVLTKRGASYSTTLYKMKTHTLYGATANVLFKITPRFQVGGGAVYNQHTASFATTNSPSVATNMAFTEISGNVVLSVGF